MTRWHIPFFALALLAAPVAHAKKEKDEGIMEVGIVTFDRVFADVAKIDTKLTNTQAWLATARTNLNTSMGLKEGTTIRNGIAELKARAGDKVALVTKGNVPTLEAKEAVPTDVQKGIDAVNSLSTNLTKSIAELASIPADARALVTKTKTFPADLQKELKEGSLIDKLVAGPKAVKATTHNLGVTKELVPKSDRVVKRMNDINGVLVSEFAPGKKPASPAKAPAKAPAKR